VYTDVIQEPDQSLADATAPTVDDASVIPTATDASGTAEISPEASQVTPELSSLDSSTTPEVVSCMDRILQRTTCIHVFASAICMHSSTLYCKLLH
jgi:hypothetical protein